MDAIETAAPGPPRSNVIIEARGLRKVFRLGGETVEALRNVSLDVFTGEYLSIMGPSGSGKSTFFNMVGGLDVPTAGSVRVHGIDLKTLSQVQLARFRCLKIGYVFQSYNLIPVQTALQNVMLPMLFLGTPPSEAAKKAASLLSEVGLGDRLHHRPDQLSGGQQQRVAIARALANDPSIILADEPTANLDLHTGQEIIEKLASLSRERGVTIISATHDHKMLSVSDRIVWVRSGEIERVEERKDIKIEVGTIE
ncbi:MAG: ABC transporter ATP-binding protein [Kiritimatiellaeota bacterium]|nr:ABC transporter ATP-binding protein [Kiritimatiellota bacterium]